MVLVLVWHLTDGAMSLRLKFTGWFINWSALKMTKYKEKLKYLNWSANCSSQKVLSVNPQKMFIKKVKVFELS